VSLCCTGNAEDAELPSVLQVKIMDFAQTNNGYYRAKITPQTFTCPVIWSHFKSYLERGTREGQIYSIPTQILQ